MEDYQYFMRYSPYIDDKAKSGKDLRVNGGKGLLRTTSDWFQSNPFAFTKTILKHATKPVSSPVTMRKSQQGQMATFTCTELDGSVPSFMQGGERTMKLGEFCAHAEVPESLEVCLLVMGQGEKARVTVTHHGSGLAINKQLSLLARADVAHVAPRQIAEKIFAATGKKEASIDALRAASVAEGVDMDLDKVFEAIESTIEEGRDVTKLEWILAYVHESIGSEAKKEYILELTKVLNIQPTFLVDLFSHCVCIN